MRLQLVRERVELQELRSLGVALGEARGGAQDVEVDLDLLFDPRAPNLDDDLPACPQERVELAKDARQMRPAGHTRHLERTPGALDAGTHRRPHAPVGALYTRGSAVKVPGDEPATRRRERLRRMPSTRRPAPGWLEHGSPFARVWVVRTVRTTVTANLPCAGR